MVPVIGTLRNSALDPAREAVPDTVAATAPLPSERLHVAAYASHGADATLPPMPSPEVVLQVPVVATAASEAGAEATLPPMPSHEAVSTESCAYISSHSSPREFICYGCL